MNRDVTSEARDMVAHFLSTQRKKLGLSRAQLAERTELAETTIKLIETNKLTPSGSNLLKLCDAMGCYFYLAERESNDPVVAGISRLVSTAHTPLKQVNDTDAE